MDKSEEKQSFLKVMVVDDEMIVREDIKTIFDWERHGFILSLEASNGKAAIRMFEQNPVDIIIADIEMPIMNGLEMAKKILAIAPQVKIIFLTAYSNFEYLRSSMRMGIHSYVLKHEIDEKVLLQELETLRREILSHRALERASEQTQEGNRIREEERAEGRIDQIRRYIERNYSQDISLEELASSFQLTESYLSHQFKSRMGVSFKSYLKQVRMEKAKEYLLSGKYRITEIARKTGYSSLQYFYLVFKQYYGVTPAEFIKSEI